MLQDLNAAMHAADLAALASACRAVLGRSREDVDDVVSLALTVTHDAPGMAVIEVELRDAAGHAVGGMSL
jgi:hypothetical protein